MVLLFDTNVIIDWLLVRKPHYDDAVNALDACERFEIEGYVSFHSMSIMWYLLRKHFPPEGRRPLLESVTNLLTVTATPHNAVVDAIRNEKMPDFEDGLQEKCALEVGADYIVTRNVKDFAASQVKAVTPAEMIEIIFKN